MPMTPEEAMDLRLLRRCTYAGRPYGEEGFVALFDEQFQRKWRRWGFEDKRQVRTFAGPGRSVVATFLDTAHVDGWRV